MYKTLILAICCYALPALAAEDCQLDIQKIADNRLVFSYTPEAQVDGPYFYVKAITDHEISETKLDAIMSKGANLLFVQNTTPRIYKLPEHSKMLYIFKATSRLQGVDAAAEIIPKVNDPQILTANATRNANNYLQTLPLATHQMQKISMDSKDSDPKMKIKQMCLVSL